MGRGVLPLATLLLSALVVSALPTLPWPARVLAAFLLVVLPVLLIAQAAALPALEDVPRAAIYLSSALAQWILAGVVLTVVWLTGMLAQLPLTWPGAATVWGWSAALTFGALTLVWFGRSIGVRESPLLTHLLPRTAAEKAAFAGLSVTAGVCEEFIYRGFLLGVLLLATGSALLATLLSAGAFGLVHAYQQPAGAARAAALGVLLSMPVLLHDSIWPAVIAHTAIDLLAGLLLRERLLR